MVSSIMVFDTLPVLVLIAGAFGLIGPRNERTKWRLVALGILGISIVIAIWFGIAIYTDPIARLLGIKS